MSERENDEFDLAEGGESRRTRMAETGYEWAYVRVVDSTGNVVLQDSSLINSPKTSVAFAKRLVKMNWKGLFTVQVVDEKSGELIFNQANWTPPPRHGVYRSNKNIEDQLSDRTINILKKADIQMTVSALSSKSDGELMRLQNFGRKSLKEVRNATLIAMSNG